MIRAGTRLLARVAVCACSMLGAADVAALEVIARTSPHGIAFLHAAVPGERSVSLRVSWPSAWAYTEGATATPFVGSDLLVQGGAGRASPAEVYQAIEDLQADIDVRVEPDRIELTLGVPTRHLGAVLPTVAAMLAEPAFDERWFVRLRDDFAADIAASKRRTYTEAQDALFHLLLGDVPLQRALAPSAAVAADVALDDVWRWHDIVFVRRGVTAVVAGGIDADAAGEAVDALLDGLPEGPALAPPPSVDADFSPRTVLLHRPERPTSAIALTGQLPPLARGHGIVDNVAVDALNDGTGSPLNQALRTRLRATYGARASSRSETRALRMLRLYAEVDTAKLAEARAALRQVYAAFLVDGSTDERIAGAARALADELRDDFASARSILGAVTLATIDGRDPTRVPATVAEAAAVTRRDVLDRIDDAWPAADALIEVVVSPDADAIEGACVVRPEETVDRCRSGAR